MGSRVRIEVVDKRKALLYSGFERRRSSPYPIVIVMDISRLHNDVLGMVFLNKSGGSDLFYYVTILRCIWRYWRSPLTDLIQDILFLADPKRMSSNMSQHHYV
jgi:hypothetical protein